MHSKESDAAALNFVCVATGDLYGLADIYIERLFRMLHRKCSMPFTLWCITDRPRSVSGSIRMIECSAWTELHRAGMRPTTLKIGLFNPAYIPLKEFIYLDLSLVIRANLAPLIEFAKARDEPLVIVNDWFYDCYNSSVMRIRNSELKYIYDAFVAGETYPQRVKGDQDFVHGVIGNRGRRDQVALIPSEMVCSFPLAARTAKHHSAVSKRMVEKSLIVKFHGPVKMHEAFQKGFYWRKYCLKYLWRYGKFGLPFSIQLLNSHWIG